MATCIRPNSDSWSAFSSCHTSIANSLNDHFLSISTCRNNDLPSPTTSYDYSTPLRLTPISTELCEEALLDLKLNKSTGSDNIPALALKISHKVIAKPLSSIINTSITSSSVPSSWKHALVKPLHKGGDRCQLSNYRPIALLPLCSKILECCVCNLYYNLYCAKTRWPISNTDNWKLG